MAVGTLPLRRPPGSTPKLADPSATNDQRYALKIAQDKLTGDASGDSPRSDVLGEDVKQVLLAQASLAPAVSIGDGKQAILSLTQGANVSPENQTLVSAVVDSVLSGAGLDTQTKATLRDFAANYPVSARPTATADQVSALRDKIGADTWDQLSPHDQDELAQVTAGRYVENGGRANDTLDRLVSSDAYKADSSADQSERVGQMLVDQSWLDDSNASAGVPTSRDGVRSTYDIKLADAGANAADGRTHYDVTVHAPSGDRTIPVALSTTDPTHAMNIDQVAKALAQLPEQNLSLVKQVVTNGDSGFNAYALGSTFVFQGLPGDQEGADRVALHESSHTVEFALAAAEGDGVGIGAGQFGKQWDAAVASDGLDPSRYGKQDNVEDFAESSRLYNEVVGTDDEAQTRALYPQRFALLDEIYKPGGSLQNIIAAQAAIIAPPASTLPGSSFGPSPYDIAYQAAHPQSASSASSASSDLNKATRDALAGLEDSAASSEAPPLPVSSDSLTDLLNNIRGTPHG